MLPEKPSPLNIHKLLKTVVWSLFFLTSVFFNLLSATSIELKKEYDRWVHRAWTTENGLPQNTVYALAQDRDGCLWIGSEGGLGRFDGSVFTVFKKNSTLGLASDSITALCPDRDGSLWIGTFGGGLRRFRDGKFETIEGMEGGRIWSLRLDGAEILWVVRDKDGMYCLEKGRSPARAVIDDLPHERVTAVSGSEKDILWIGTPGGLAAIRNGRETVFRVGDGLAGDYVYCLFTDSRGSLWVGTTSGLSRIDAVEGVRSFSTADGLADNLVRAIGEDAKGRMWIGTDKGITIMEPGKETLCAIPDGLAGDAVMAILRDREGNMWVGTSAGGLHFLRQNEVRVLGADDGLSGQQISSICEDAAGRFWVGTSDQGLNLLAGGEWRSFSKRDGLASDVITSLLADRGGRLWIGTRNAGLQCLDRDGFTSYSRRDGMAGDTVLSLFIDRRQALWIGGEGSGLDRFRDGEWRHHGLAGGLKGGTIIALNEDRQGSFLAGSSGAGLHVLRDGAWRQYTMADGLAGDTVYAIHVDGKDDVWLGTNGGLSLLRQGRIFKFSEASGPLNGAILNILEDDSGHLWMSSPAGIFRVKKSGCEAYVMAEDKDLHCRLFNEMSGLKSTVCAGGFQPAGCRSRDGRLWFPTEKGLAMIDPQRLGTMPPPAAWIEKVQVDGRSFPMPGGSRFPAGTKRLDFVFAAAAFADPRQVEFSTRLEGREDHWSAPTRERGRQFTGLAAGTYDFRVRARSQSGDWQEEAAAFAFAILPYFYQTAPFYFLLLAGSVAAAAGLFFVRRRLDRRRRQDKYRLSTLTDGKLKEYMARLERAMEMEKLYLDPDLTLVKLAESAGIPAKHLSQLINERYELNFNDFINRQRVEEAKRKLLDPAAREFKLLRIAFESGFNSKSVFNSAFKKITGLSPSEFRRLLGGV
jgi:ligand-binding sensor domain-containing protein/AraC-like DNA-binding protein